MNVNTFSRGWLTPTSSRSSTRSRRLETPGLAGCRRSWRYPKTPQQGEPSPTTPRLDDPLLLGSRAPAGSEDLREVGIVVFGLGEGLELDISGSRNEDIYLSMYYGHKNL